MSLVEARRALRVVFFLCLEIQEKMCRKCRNTLVPKPETLGFNAWKFEKSSFVENDVRFFNHRQPFFRAVKLWPEWSEFSTNQWKKILVLEMFPFSSLGYELSSSEGRSKAWRHTTVCWIFARFEAVGERSRSFASRSYWHLTARWSHNSQDMLCSTKDIASLHFFELRFAKVGYLDDFSGSVFGWEETSHNYVKSFVHCERCLHKVFTISSTHVKCKGIVVPAPHSTNTKFVPTGGVLERRAMVPKADFLFGTTDFGETPTTLVADGIFMAIFRRRESGMVQTDQWTISHSMVSRFASRSRHSGIFPYKKTSEQWSKPWLFPICRNEILPSYIWILINQHKHPY